MASEEQPTTSEVLNTVYGTLSEDSANPFLALPNAGGQWPEERAFARMANVYALARLTEVLVGAQGYFLYGGEAGDASIRKTLPPEMRQECAQAVAVIIKGLVEICPDIISSEPVNVPGWDVFDYVADDRMQSMIERAYERGGLETTSEAKLEFDE